MVTATKKKTSWSYKCDQCGADVSSIENGDMSQCRCGAYIHGRNGFATTITEPKQKEKIRLERGGFIPRLNLSHP